MNTTTFVHCTGADVEIYARDNGDDIVLDLDHRGAVTIFLSEEQASRIILKLSNAVTEHQAKKARVAS